MTRKILKLEIENEYEFLLAGIISGWKDYRLCYELNQLLQLNLTRLQDVVVPAGKPGSSTRHSGYAGAGKNNETYHIVSNRDKDGTGNLIPEMKSIDYFIIISDAPANFDLNGLIKKLRAVENISGVYDIDPTGLKSADAFLLLLEA